MNRLRRSIVTAVASCAMLLSMFAAAGAFDIPIASTQAQVWVAGRQIAFAHLAIAYGDPVTPADDPGLRAMLAAVAARSSWQPGTRFVAITRADGRLVTFSLGSNAVSVDGVPTPMPFAPFSSGSRFYLPLLPLARALDLGVRGFHAGYVLVPQIVSVTPRHEARSIVVRVVGSAPVAWHSAISGPARDRKLTISFPGFGTDAIGTLAINSGVAASANVSESGPPGYPTTSVAIALKPGARFVTRRVGIGAAVDVAIAHDDAALRAVRPASTPASVHVAVTPISTVPPSPRPPSPSPTAVATPVTVSSPEGSALPAPEPTDVATAEPLGPGAQPSSSQSPGLPAPSASPSPLAEQKITLVSVAETATGTRITLTLTGPVAFEWHRLADPDNRYWLDIDKAMLIGPAQTLQSKLAFIKEIKLSQHLLVPESVVRLSITPSQSVDVRVGSIVGAPNQLGIEIENRPPPPDAPTAGIGNTVVVAQTTSPPSPSRMDADLIVIDPGHGGTDPGSMNTGVGLTESRLTLAISQRLATILKHEGWQVTLTRDGDYDVGDPNGSDSQELQARCDVANASGARLFVSVHINSSVSSAPSGATTYYWHPQDRAFAQSVQNDIIAASGINDDGVIRNNFYVIHHTVMPSILVEAGYLSNAHDATLLTQSAFLDKMAAGIAQGIDDFTGGPAR